MSKDDTITVQEVRKDPIGFLSKINSGQTLVVIYRSRPFATVRSADAQMIQPPKSTKRMLAYAELARNSAKTTLDPDQSYKEMYDADMAKKYGISRR